MWTAQLLIDFAHTLALRDVVFQRRTRDLQRVNEGLGNDIRAGRGSVRMVVWVVGIYGRDAEGFVRVRGVLPVVDEGACGSGGGVLIVRDEAATTS